MKKLIILTLAIVFQTSLFAQQVATLQSGGVTTVFNGTAPLVDAYNASANGDTILLSGGPFSTPSAFAKGITIIGAGFYPDSTTATLPTLLAGDFQVNNGADSLYLEGVEISGTLHMLYSHTVNYVSIVRCYLHTVNLESGSIYSSRSGDATNWSFIQCVIDGSLDAINVENSIFANNIFEGQLLYSVNNTLQNNLFLFEISYSGPLHYCSNNTVSNNIFRTQYVIASSSSSNFYQNNVVVSANPNYGTTAIATNNYTNVPMDSVFTTSITGTVDLAVDYHLKPSAATNYLGFDNTPVGIYGGFMPLREGWMPMNPHISFKQIPGVTNNQGILNIQVKARAQQ